MNLDIFPKTVEKTVLSDCDILFKAVQILKNAWLIFINKLFISGKCIFEIKPENYSSVTWW